MSNIVLKGDVIQNIGEYLPNPYIEKINVTDNGSGMVSLEIDYSLMFMVSDEYDITDIGTNLSRLNLYGFVTTSEQVLTKREAIDKFIENNTGSYTEEVGFGDISRNLNNGDYNDNIYDSDDRQIIKATATFSITEISPSDIESGNLYLYMFSTLSSRGDMSINGLGYLTTSNFAYEKVFSPNLNVLKEELPIYLTTEGEKYGQVPLLGLDRRFYQNRTVTRSEIISKVRSLVSRFNGSSNSALQQNIDNINLVILTEANSENLLVELDKVRRSFTSKTNNNPIGNLYAAYSVLLQNINSSFPRTERLNKQKYLTGKVIDMRAGLTSGLSILEPSDSSDYIPSDFFLIHRERLSTDNESEDLGVNKGNFFIRYEDMLKKESDIFKIISQKKFYEIATDRSFNDLRRVLFSYFNLTQVVIYKDKGDAPLSSAGVSYRTGFEALPFGAVDNEGVSSTLTHQNFSFTEPEEVTLCYYFDDRDSFSAIEEVQEIEDSGGFTFDYEIKCKLKDNTYDFVEYLIKKYTDIFNSLEEYKQYANELCSYNNIDNKFNNFFTKNIRDEYPNGDYPWEQAPAIYSIMAYLLTNQFVSYNETKTFCKNKSANINPEEGSLSQLNTFYDQMENLLDNEIPALQLQMTSIGRNGTLEYDKEITISLTPFNYEETLAEANAEFGQLLVYPAEDIVIWNSEANTQNNEFSIPGGATASDLGYGTSQQFYDTLTSAIDNMYDEIFINITRKDIKTAIYDTDLTISDLTDLGKSLGTFLYQINNYFADLRNDSLRGDGVRKVFDFEIPIGEYLTDQRPSMGFKRNLKNTITTEMVKIALKIDDSVSRESIVAQVDRLTATYSNQIANLILNYYRSNMASGTPKIFYDINRAEFGPYVDNPIILKMIETGAQLPLFPNYSGPPYGEIPNIQDEV